MRPRGAAVLALVFFILLLAFGSYLLNVPMAVIVIATTFAIGVILWLASRSGEAQPHSHTPSGPEGPDR